MQETREYSDGQGRLNERGRDAVAKNHGIAISIAKVYAKRWKDEDEIYSIAREALVDAALSFDASFGASFSTHAHRRIRWRILSFFKEVSLRNLKKGPDASVAMDTIAHEGPPASNRIEAMEERELAKKKMDRLLSILHPQYAEAVRMKFEDGLTSAEAGSILGEKPGTICMRRRRAMEQLRRFAKAEFNAAPH